MRTVLLVSDDEALDVRLLRALPDCSVFPAPTDEEALRTLRLTEVDLILKHVAQPVGDLDGLHREGTAAQTQRGGRVHTAGRGPVA